MLFYCIAAVAGDNWSFSSLFGKSIDWGQKNCTNNCTIYCTISLQLFPPGKRYLNSLKLFDVVFCLLHVPVTEGVGESGEVVGELAAELDLGENIFLKKHIYSFTQTMKRSKVIETHKSFTFPMIFL